MMTIPTVASVNIERMLQEHLAQECERERRTIADLETELQERRVRLRKLQAIGDAADVATDFEIVEDHPQIERAA